MSEDPETRAPEATAAGRIARLEARLARIETQLGIADGATPAPARAVFQPRAPPAAAGGRTEEEFEFEVGQNWFALAGVAVLTLGAAFFLSLPFPSLPAALPSLGGYATVAGLFAVAHRWRRSFVLMGLYLCGAAMVLLLVATLRLFFPLSRPAVSLDSLAGHALLAVTLAINLTITWPRKSPWLTGLALATGCAMVIVAVPPWFALTALGLLVALAAGASHRTGARMLALAALPAGYATYLAWALGNPLLGAPLHFATGPALAPAAVLACAVIFAAGEWLRPTAERESAGEIVGALLNCALGYGVFFMHTMAAFPAGVAGAHAIAFVVFLGLAAAFWVRRRSQGATFFYAMTGYAALSVAILKAAEAPAVFVWLSVQSVVVVATAVWFRSRFIVVANFLIYVAIVIGYALLAERETGISLGFGVVALVSARILNWQQSRLELKTGLMRNAYLASAFLAFPYALYHLVPARHVGLAWVGLALAYYALNLAGQNQKYRWMGHATLLLTACYLVVAGTGPFEAADRVRSFLVLGTVLLVVSLVFARLRRRRLAPRPSGLPR